MVGNTAQIFYENLIHIFSCNHCMTNVYLSLLIDFNHVKVLYVLILSMKLYIYICVTYYIYSIVQMLQF